MTPMQREELDLEIKHVDDSWKPLNRRTEISEWPWWLPIILWIVVWVLVGIVAVFAFDKLEALARVRWPRL